MDYKGYGEEESGKLLAPNRINLGKLLDLIHNIKKLLDS
ncbi:BnaA10g27760D [Brassica napus]|uniref:(rape) hypothetical protein n=1 Tax=Brassica napus TaxID=3708 RepID=A0A078J3V8_BRANA|nr:unnamed protein product [Brassica napus]CDY60664.1 BnaA10g27760D [Brassica napus]